MSLKNIPAYHVHRGMKQRCYNKNYDQYSNYGGKGITVCDEWKDNVVEFSKWAVSNGYMRGLTIDRKNNDQGYTPTNCRFITREENNKNKGLYKTNLLGERNISQRKNGNYRVTAHKNKKRISLGTYKKLDEAIIARDSFLNDPSEIQKEAFLKANDVSA